MCPDAYNVSMHLPVGGVSMIRGALETVLRVVSQLIGDQQKNMLVC